MACTFVFAFFVLIMVVVGMLSIAVALRFGGMLATLVFRYKIVKHRVVWCERKNTDLCL